ncbi:MAG: helix-hairpin-helix domain-containing protein [Nitrospirae bacterium]|nr:helix-hairpin-helix domain-containing protein [Nitrospirota bacterium]
MDKCMFKKQTKKIIVSIFLLLLCCITSIEAKTFKVASYNVENLFDLTVKGTEYPEYIPNTGYGWTKDIANIKYNNIAGAIKDLGADVIALQEVESKEALTSLRNRLNDLGADYPYFAIADSRAAPVKCAILSKFPIIDREEIQVDNPMARNILKVTLDIAGNRIILFINHWKSKNGPESLRIAYAKTLKREIDKLKEDADFILIGDFNSNYDEYKTFRDSDKLDDTVGITGINHILRTVKDSEMVNENLLTEQAKNESLYNLWLEVRETGRWSYIFSGKKESPDSIIVSKGLYDNKGISYSDNSFDKFQPGYLFKDGTIYRWQMTERGRGKHIGKGYSDHLPIFAYFSTEAFRIKKNNIVSSDTASNDLSLEKTKSPQGLLDLNTAGKEELMSINGIGPVLSGRIIAGRPYRTVDELLKVKGIGPKNLERFRPYVMVR